MSNGNAPRGGMVGVNGDFYKGGQFLPSTERPKGKASSRKPRRIEIEPGVYAPVPAGVVAVLGRFTAVSVYDRETRTFELLPADHPVWGMFGADRATEYREDCARWLELYNRGERYTVARG